MLWYLQPQPEVKDLCIVRHVTTRDNSLRSVTKCYLIHSSSLLGSESSLFKLTRRMVRALKKARFPTTTFEGGNKQRIGDKVRGGVSYRAEIPTAKKFADECCWAGKLSLGILLGSPIAL